MKTRFPAMILTLALCLGLCAVPVFAVDAADATEEDIQSTFTILRNETTDETEGVYTSSKKAFVNDAYVDYQVYDENDSWTITNTGSKAISCKGNTDYTISFGYISFGKDPWADMDSMGEIGGSGMLGYTDDGGVGFAYGGPPQNPVRLKAGEAVVIPASAFVIGPAAETISGLYIHIIYEGDGETVNSFWRELFFGYDPAEKAAIEQALPPSGFTDVPDWCAPAVDWAVENKITEGVGGNRFAPSNPCTHAQILTFLWRAEGEIPSTAALPVDISGKNLAYAETALRWAAEKGMIGEGFDPTAPCTRADAVIYIWKAFDTMGADGWFGFIDIDDSDEMLFGAVSYAVCCGIANGYDNGDGTFSFRPGKVCSRGEIVTLLHRAYVPEASLNPS